MKALLIGGAIVSFILTVLLVCSCIRCSQMDRLIEEQATELELKALAEEKYEAELKEKDESCNAQLEEKDNEKTKVKKELKTCKADLAKKN